MKDKIHPTYHANAKVTCACGASWETGSTAPEISVEICSKCHPFYTGKQRLVDTARRVEKFQERVTKTTAAASARGDKKTKKAKRLAQKLAKKPKAEVEEA